MYLCQHCLLHGTGEDFSHSITCAYDEIVTWKRNIFRVPSGAIGKKFVSELSRLFHAYADSSALESFALKAAMVLPALLLQKPFHHSTAKYHVKCLERRLVKWHAGHIDDLIHESRTIQRQLTKPNGPHMEEQLARKFGKLMRVGNVRAAVRLLSNSVKGGVLSLDSIPPGSSESVRDILIKKHPIGQPLHSHTPLTLEHLSPSPYPVQFDQLNAASIHTAALRTSGATGPSGLDDSGYINEV